MSIGSDSRRTCIQHSQQHYQHNWFRNARSCSKSRNHRFVENFLRISSVKSRNLYSSNVFLGKTTGQKFIIFLTFIWASYFDRNSTQLNQSTKIGPPYRVRATSPFLLMEEYNKISGTYCLRRLVHRHGSWQVCQSNNEEWQWKISY